MVADAHKHTCTDTKIETKSISPHFGLSPTGANDSRKKKREEKAGLNVSGSMLRPSTGGSNWNKWDAEFIRPHLVFSCPTHPPAHGTLKLAARQLS